MADGNGETPATAEADGAKPAEPAPKTLDKRWLERLRNHPAVAAILVGAAIVTGVGAFWTGLPESWRATFTAALHPAQHDSTPEGGWVFAGYVDPMNDFHWTSKQRLAVTQQSGGQQRAFVFRTGDTVQAQEELKQVIVDYKTKQTANQLVPPWTLRGKIDYSKDGTGRVYAKGSHLEVMDVSEGMTPGKDIAVWVRVRPLADGEKD